MKNENLITEINLNNNTVIMNVSKYEALLRKATGLQQANEGKPMNAVIADKLNDHAEKLNFDTSRNETVYEITD